MQWKLNCARSCHIPRERIPRIFLWRAFSNNKVRKLRAIAGRLRTTLLERKIGRASSNQSPFHRLLRVETNNRLVGWFASTASGRPAVTSHSKVQAYQWSSKSEIAYRARTWQNILQKILKNARRILQWFSNANNAPSSCIVYTMLKIKNKY